MWTPNHSHKDTHQLVVSLGVTRTLQVGEKKYSMVNGSAIIFGSSIHGVPKDETVTGGRISIATFMVPKVSTPLPKMSTSSYKILKEPEIKEGYVNIGSARVPIFVLK